MQPIGSHAVSVLDLNNIAFGPVARDPPLLGRSAILMFLYQRCQNFRPVGRANTSADVLADQAGSKEG